MINSLLRLFCSEWEDEWVRAICRISELVICGKGGKGSRGGKRGTVLEPFWRIGRRVGDESGEEPVSEVFILSTGCE